MLLQCAVRAAIVGSGVATTRSAAAAWALLSRHQQQQQEGQWGPVPPPPPPSSSTSRQFSSSRSLRDAAASAASAAGVSALPDALPAATAAHEVLSSCAATAGSSSADLLSSCGSFAAQPLEPLLHLLNPVVMGCSVWELAHSATGLPWWASIPLTTLALRTALLPLTLKAKSAGLNFVLAQHATQTATNLVEHWKQQQDAQSADAATASSSSSTRSSSGSSASGRTAAAGRQGVFEFEGGEQLRRPSKWRLTRLYYRYYRKQHGTTSLWWWTTNVAVQLNLFVAMSMALRQMAATQWPGMTDQGYGLFADLTQPAVLWPGAWNQATLATCPYGTAGLLMPFVLLAIYLKTVEQSPLGQRSTKALAGLQALSLPYFVMACTAVPHATLLYWATNSAFYYGLQWALQQPRIAARLNLPSIMLPPPTRDKDARERAERDAFAAQQLICGSEDAGFLRYLAASYRSRGKHQPALQCLERLTVLAPGDAAGYHALGMTAVELQRWPVAARAFERAAELRAVAVERDESVECLMLAGKQWLNATAEARAMQKRERRKQQAAAGTPPPPAAAASGPAAGGAAQDAAATAATSSSSDKAVQPKLQQEYINNALHVLEQAVHFQSEGGRASDAWYLLAMARAADGQWAPALEAANTFWAAVCVQPPEQGEAAKAAKVNAAAKLLPVLHNLCKQCAKRGDYESLLSVGRVAIDVARCGWDRQTEEGLRDTLGAAAQAASAGGDVGAATGLRELQQQLPCMQAAAAGRR